MKDKDYGSIETTKSYNDVKKTQLAYEHFKFNGHTIALAHPLDEDGYRNPDYVSVSTPSGEFDISIYPDRIEIYHTVPSTAAAVQWIDENIGEDNGYQPNYPAILVEPCYVADILIGMVNDGLAV